MNQLKEEEEEEEEEEFDNGFAFVPQAEFAESQPTTCSIRIDGFFIMLDETQKKHTTHSTVENLTAVEPSLVQTHQGYPCPLTSPSPPLLLVIVMLETSEKERKCS